MEKLRAKIMSRIAIINDCWEWQGAKNPTGYGNIAVSCTNRKCTYSTPHKIMYELTYGPVPDGMFVCHKCDNPPCCNPDHLFAGTQKANLDDMRHKGRALPSKRLSELRKIDWTPERKAIRAEVTRERMRLAHEEKARLAGVPIDWKYCPDCQTWYPRSNFQKNKARHDGIKPICKKCSTIQMQRLRVKNLNT